MRRWQCGFSVATVATPPPRPWLASSSPASARDSNGGGKDWFDGQIRRSWRQGCDGDSAASLQRRWPLLCLTRRRLGTATKPPVICHCSSSSSSATVLFVVEFPNFFYDFLRWGGGGFLGKGLREWGEGITG
ncbi:uncharacterized protein DS421_17g577200 [Arachis hypogaea]|nr:uncharacterized protein DS421_17g577200 [Arachis hypogaea]